MENKVLKWLDSRDREEAVRFLKSLWCETPQPCPLCGAKLDFLHKKAKKSNNDWVCTACGTRFDTIKLLNELNGR